MSNKRPQHSAVKSVMGGPTRSRSRSTTVFAPAAASGGQGKHRKKHSYSKGKKANKGKQTDNGAAKVTWDHDDSSGSDSDHPEASSSATAAAAVKGLAGAAGTEAVVPVAAKRQKRSWDDKTARDAASTGDRKPLKKALKRPRESGASFDDQGPGDDDEPGGTDGSDSERSVQDDKGEQGSDAETSKEKGKGATTAQGGGGMGDVMARILGQKVDTRTQAPVLAKRKTKAMKEMEEASAKRAESRGKSAARRANMTQQFVIPDHTTAEYERQLKKISTRGVVALFNAISKRQKEEHLAGEGSDKVQGTAKAAAIKGASRHAFLDMLKTGVTPVEGGTGNAGGGGGLDRAGAGSGVGRENNGDEKAGGGRSWSVLKEDYMLGSSTMKSWDQESVESEPDALEGGEAMSDDSD